MYVLWTKAQTLKNQAGDLLQYLAQAFFCLSESVFIAGKCIHFLPVDSF